MILQKKTRFRPSKLVSSTTVYSKLINHKKRMTTFMSLLIASYLVLFPSYIMAAKKTTLEVKTPPNLMIENTTKKAISIIKKHRKNFDKNTTAFYTDIELILDDVVAFDQFARGVMGKYAHRATNEQRAAFANTFKGSLITFYGKAVMNFNTDDISFDPISPIPKETIERYTTHKIRSIPVETKLHSNNREYTISYSLIESDDSWKVRNIIVEGINIGVQFRNQFSAAIEEYKTIDGVIANWASIMQSQVIDHDKDNKPSEKKHYGK